MCIRELVYQGWLYKRVSMPRLVVHVYKRVSIPRSVCRCVCRHLVLKGRIRHFVE